MLASLINQDRDIEIFLSDEEVKKLQNNSLEGEILNFIDIRDIYPLKIFLEKRREYYPNNISLKINGKEHSKQYLVCISDVIPITSYYEQLKKRRWIGTRAGYFKVDIMTEEFANKHEDFSKDLKSIKNKYENRDRIIKKIESEEL